MMASVATFESVATTARNPHKTRKRASKACLSCRARKVRCDVSQRGRPCMNCYLDSETCIVTSRASRFRKAEREGNQRGQPSHPSHRVHDRSHTSVVDDTANTAGDRESVSSQPEFVDHVDDPCAVEHVHPPHIAFEENMDIQQDQQLYSGFNGHPESPFSRLPNAQYVFNNPSPTPLQSFGSLGNSGSPFMGSDNPATINADITYSYYPFLSISNLHNVIPQDVNFLESQGCFRIPTREILDEFVQQYFLHIHPLLPFINEGDFWNLYCRQGSLGAGQTMSLLVFQAMLFSCCNFVSKTSIKALGFPNIRTARATLYRRTKLLFDFDTESSLVCVAQAALLLTYWAPNWSLASKKPNTAWLGVAIQNARSAEAHIYSAMPTFSPVTEPVEYKKQNSLKRLWWCCVFRDRLVSLNMRRSIQVSRAHFDVDSNNSLSFSDLSDEISLSKVYNTETKRRLIEIFIQLGALCSVMTDLLALVFPLDDAPGWGRRNRAEDADKVRECKAALRTWYRTATIRFPMFSRGSAPNRKAGDKHFRHDSVILYTNLMYMFYYSAQAALCQHEVLQAVMASASPNTESNLRGFSNVYESRNELQDAASGVTECMNELIQRRLARWLPITAISCTAMPLVLHIIDVKLSSQNKRIRATPEEQRRTALKQQRLNVLIEAMKTYQPQYDGVDYISETIRHIVNLAQIDPPSNVPNSSGASAVVAASSSDNNSVNGGIKPIISDWTDILASNPGSYLLLSLTMDISMSKGRLAKETDFPVKLRGLFAQGLSPIHALLANTNGGHRGSIIQQTPSAASSASAGLTLSPDPTTRIPLGSVHSVSSDEDSASPDSVSGTDSGKTTTTTMTATATATGSGDSNNNNNAAGPPLLAGSLSPLVHDMHDDPDGVFGDVVDYSLTADALAAYVSQGGDGDGTGEGVGEGDRETTDWFVRAWDDAGDKETARALLDALHDDSGLGAV
ncbi:hypothetical protein F4777DRAFT_214880 [Nemania sp. FL0916]|nr:hypothetical protein F4777DRAFT_214880 [Nemania sp. FL0916]